MKPEEIVFSEEDYKAVEEHIDDIAKVVSHLQFDFDKNDSLAKRFGCYWNFCFRSFADFEFIPICNKICETTYWSDIRDSDEYKKSLDKLRDNIYNAISEIENPQIYQITFDDWRNEHCSKVFFIKAKKSELNNAIKTLTKEVMEGKDWQAEDGLPLYDVAKLDIREF